MELRYLVRGYYCCCGCHSRSRLVSGVKLSPRFLPPPQRQTSHTVHSVAPQTSSSPTTTPSAPQGSNCSNGLSTTPGDPFFIRPTLPDSGNASLDSTHHPLRRRALHLAHHPSEAITTPRLAVPDPGPHPRRHGCHISLRADHVRRSLCLRRWNHYRKTECAGIL